MHQLAWEEIEQIYNLPNVSTATITQFRKLKSSQSSHTKAEGNPIHYCSFFLPYDTQLQKIYLGHHIKADDWLSPGGHIEPGETPKAAAVREMQEELGYSITEADLIPFNLSIKNVGRADRGCLFHYDIWHLVSVNQQDFTYDTHEYYDAGWFSIEDGVKKITKNPDFASIISQLSIVK